jgi:hypothetical protein
MQRLRLAILAALIAAGPALADEEQAALDAFAFITASGKVLQVGTAAHVFAGSLEGPYFVDVGQGPVPAGSIACGGLLEADETSGRQVATANCRLQALDGAVAFGRFRCEGFRLIGCTGPFELTGGEGRMAGVTGEGTITLRRYETALAAGDGGMIDEAALGIAFWKDFRVNLPQAAQ